MTANRLGLFQAFGVELEYMLVRRGDLAVLPLSDEALRRASGGEAYVCDVERDGMAWSNELVAHLVELKVDPPARDLAGLAPKFDAEIAWMNGLLEAFDARLMPSAMHPFMRPEAETKLWPHEYREIYESYHKAFDCRRHGWANLQSAHLNLPFADDAEFGRLHAAIRLLLPLLPALAASSPYQEGRATGLLDTRLENYRGHMALAPATIGAVIPEPVYTEEEYRRRIFAPMFAQIAQLDTDENLQQEFLNARGAIARFDRGAIEVRVMDVQECPQADLAIAGLVTRVLRALVDERWCGLEAQKVWPAEQLFATLLATTRAGERARLEDPRFLEAFGWCGSNCEAGALWKKLFEDLWPADPARPADPDRVALAQILEHGPLARRLLKKLGPRPERADLEAVYRELCDCLAAGRLYGV